MRCVGRVAWDEAPFGEIIDWLRQQSAACAKVNVIPRWRALARAGVDAETPVTLEMEHVAVSDVLEQALDQLSGADPLMFVAQGNVLRITTRSDIRGRLYTRAYDVAEIIAHGRADRISPRFIAGQQMAIGAAVADEGGIGGVTGVLNIGATLFGEDEDDEDDADVSDDEIIAALIHLIQTTIEPDSWTVNGGRGTLTVLDGVLVVRNSADVHAALADGF